MAMLKKLLTGEDGATAVEYGMMVALIAAVIVVIVGVLGGQVNDAFNTISAALP
ncbi:MAG: Flp family type IVb pilin [Chloroflexi bacterium]|nr:Flp family type IVb pilin [Chloroflexota bacterium]